MASRSIPQCPIICHYFDTRRLALYLIPAPFVCLQQVRCKLCCARWNRSECPCGCHTKRRIGGSALLVEKSVHIVPWPDTWFFFGLCKGWSQNQVKIFQSTHSFIGPSDTHVIYLKCWFFYHPLGRLIMHLFSLAPWLIISTFFSESVQILRSVLAWQGSIVCLQQVKCVPYGENLAKCTSRLAIKLLYIRGLLPPE